MYHVRFQVQNEHELKDSAKGSLMKQGQLTRESLLQSRESAIAIDRLMIEHWREVAHIRMM